MADTSVFRIRWFMMDFARRRIFVREEIELLLDMLVRCGYNGFGFYMEGYFNFPSLCGSVHERCITPEDARWLHEVCEQRGLQLMPLTNLGGHAGSFLSQERFRHLGSSQFRFQLPEVKSFAKTVIDDLLKYFRPRYLHIGGDELDIPEDERDLFVEYLAELCYYIRQKDVIPCVWSDMLIGDNDLRKKYADKEPPEVWGKRLPEYTVPAKKFIDDVMVLDWWYGGHRRESIELLQNAGYQHIVVCPGTQSWNSPIATQFPCPWREEFPWDYRNPPDSNEVEAFLTDGLELGISNGLLCDWENFFGHTLWAGVTTIARGGLFMSAGKMDDSEIEKALFGRETPCSKSSQILREGCRAYLREVEKLPGRFLTHQGAVNSVYRPDFLYKLLMCGNLIDQSVSEQLKTAAREAQKYLTEWQQNDIQSDFERLVSRHLVFSALYLELFAYLLDLAIVKDNYRKAALIQYDDRDGFYALLRSITERIEVCVQFYPKLKEAQSAAIQGTGHTKEDLVYLDDMQRRLEKLKGSILFYMDRQEIALRKWEGLLGSVLERVDIHK